jgi:hypothetical protein
LGLVGLGSFLWGIFGRAQEQATSVRAPGQP